MKIFEDKKALKKYSEVIQAMPSQVVRTKFSDEVKELADKKVTSVGGEYKSFYVTEDEVISLAKNYVGSR